jgi:hypothetical protein
MKPEDLIWDAITDSAKRRFDYNGFAVAFDEVHENIAENVVFRVIAGFASGQPQQAMSSALFDQMVMTGMVWSKEDIDRFIEDKEQLFKVEILAMQLARTMLDNGVDPQAVLLSIGQLLE